MKVIVVHDPLFTEEDSWESHFSSILHGYVESSGRTDCTVETCNDVSLMKTYFQNGYITKNDKIVFPNAWISCIPYIKHWAEIYKINVEMIGFWSRGCFINTDPIYRPYRDRNWRKVRERGNFRCLHKSFFISEYFKEQFRIYVSKKVFPERLHVIPFPLDYVNLELSKYSDGFIKQDVIVFPWFKYDGFQEQIIYDFIRVFPKTQVIFAQEHFPMERSQILTQIARSKVVMLPYDSPNLGQEIYECILLGAIPVVPDFGNFKEMLPKEFVYDLEWTRSIISYCKYANQLTDFVNNLVVNYDQYVPLIEEYKSYMYECFFDSEKVIREIFQ